jgi:GntR family transcriptional regulator
LVNNFFEKYQISSIKGLPKYAQLREALLAAIQDGHWKPGSKLPPEGQLVRDTPFSLGTVQKALNSLVEEGIIVRRQGLGSFVSQVQQQMDRPWHLRFVSDKEGAYLPVYPKVVLRRKDVKPGLWAPLLGNKKDSFLQIDRVLNIGREFLVYAKFFANGKKFGEFLKKSNEELEKTNFKTILRRDHNQTITRMTHNLRILPLPSEVCRAIKVREETVGLVMEILAVSGTKNPVYYQELYIPPNNRKLHISDLSNISEYWI